MRDDAADQVVDRPIDRDHDQRDAGSACRARSPAASPRHPRRAGDRVVAASSRAAAACAPPRGRSKRPKAVGPEPVISGRRRARPPAAPRVASPISGRSERAAGSRSLRSSFGVVERAGAGPGRLPQALRRDRPAPPASRPRPSRSASAKTSAVERPSRPGSRTTACAPGSGSRSTISPAPRTRAKRRLAAGRGRRRRSRRRRRRATSTSSPASRRTAAASALPPPSPAATGIRFSISTRSGRTVPTALAQRRQGPGRQVLAVDLGAPHLVVVRLADLDPVGEGERLEQRAELVQAVGAPAAQIEAEVELRRGQGPQGQSAV